MKQLKKTLCVFLSLLILVSCVSVCFSPIKVSAAAPTNAQLKAAFQAITNTSDLTNGDGTLLNAAEVLYQWANGNAQTKSNSLGGSYHSPSLSAVNNNTVVNLNANAKSAVGSAYNTLINTLLPTADVYDDSSYTSYSKSGSYGVATGQGFNTGKLSYSVTSSPTKTVTVKANLEKTLLTYDSVSEIPSSILLSATYTYKHTYKTGYHTRKEDKKVWGVVVWRDWFWKTYSWHYLSAKPSRTVNSTDTNAYKNINAFNDHFIKNGLYQTSLADLCNMSASAIASLISQNNTAYAKLNSYSANVKNHFFPMSEVEAFMDNCIFAQKVINAKPAITALSSAMAAGYDTNNLSRMESIYTSQKPNLDYLCSIEAEVITYIAQNYEGFDTFSLEAATAFMNQLHTDIELYKLREIKAAVDALRATYPDAAAIAKIDTDENGNYINDNLTLWTTYDMITGYINSINNNFEKENVDAVFTEGTSYIVTFKSELKYEWDYRDAEQQYESYYAWFLPLIYQDLTKYTTEEIIGTGIPATTPNIPNAQSKKSSYNTMYSKYTGLIGADAMKVIFGDGESSLGYIIDDYIARLYAVILARLTSEVDTAIGYYEAFDKITLDNFVAVKEAIGRVETDIFDYINKNNPSIISAELRADYNKLWTILNEYNNFVATDGLADFKQKHLHDENGVFITREPTQEDKARVEGEDYNVTEEIILETIEKLDAFLISNDFTELVDIDRDETTDILLDDFIKQVMAENFYTDEFINMLMNIIYPALVGALEDVHAGLPDSVDALGTTFDLSYSSLREILDGFYDRPDGLTGLGIYPDQVAKYVANGYGTARSDLASAKTWKALEDEDGNLKINWGVNAIVPENYKTTDAYLTAKKAKFLGAMAESFDAIFPLVQVLIGEKNDIKIISDEVGSAHVLFFDLYADLTITATGCAGYSDVVVPILEAFGCTGIQTYNTVKNYTTSRQYVNAIFNPIIDLVENKLAKAPVSTICSILPNLAYSISFDKLWDLVDKLNINIHYKADDSILGIDVTEGDAPIKFNTFLTEESLNLDFDMSSFSDILTMLLSTFMPNVDFSTLPILNAGEFISYAKLNRNASTLRKNGKRLNFEADKADVFMAFLNYLVSCLGNEEFVNSLLSAFIPAADGAQGEAALTPEFETIIENIYTNPELAIAAIIELLNQTEYALESYSWYEGETDGTVEGITPAALVYLSGTNDWTKETADYVDENISSIVNTILETAGSDIDLSQEITTAINSIFTNSTLTSLAVTLSNMSKLESKVLDIVKNELNVDLSAFEKYTELPEDYSWGFEDGDRDGFIAALLEILSPLEPVYGFLFSGESLTLFQDVKGQDLVTFYGNEGYDNAIVPLLEALGCDTMTQPEFSSVDSADTLKVVIEAVTAKLDEISENPIEEILNMLPGVLYYISSDGISTSIRNLLHPVYVILDTLRPIYNIDLNDMFPPADEEATQIDIENISLDFIVSMVEQSTGLNLQRLKTIVKDVCTVVRTPYTSDSTFVGEGYKGAYAEGKFDRADMITVVISLLLELLEDEGNAAVFDEMLGTENFTAALLAFFRGVDPETKSINWMYYFGEDHDFTDYDFDTGITVEPTIYAVTYPNNWTEESAAYLNDNLDSIVSSLVSLADENYSDLGSLVKDSLNLYTPENVQAIADALRNLLTNIDADLLEMAGVVFDADFTALGNYTAPETVSGSAEFASALADILGTVPGIVNWLFLGDDYSFFTGTKQDENGEYTYNDIITIKGAEGYKKGLAPILEAIGCENLPDGTQADAVELVLKSIFARVDEILSDPANEILEVLPNVVYFLNADGLTASVYNILSAVYALSEQLRLLDVELDINELLGFDTTKLSFTDVIGYIEEETGMNLTPVKEIFAGLCVGTIKTYESLSGEYAYKMSYSSELDRKDMLTIIITVFLQVIELQDNAEILRELLGAELYDAILNILNLQQFDMQELSYIYTEHADTGFVFSAIERSEIYENHEYGPLYTQEMAQYIADNIDEFIDNIIYLLGIEIDGITVDSLKELLNTVVNGSIYNSETAQKILDALLSLTAEIDKLEGSEHIKALIKSSLGVDLDAWDNYQVLVFENDRAMFTKTVCEILEPLYPVLEWALCNKDFTFFVNEDKTDIVTLLGAEGYAYGVIPLLEALKSENILSPDAYYAAAEADQNAMITSILNPLLDRIDVIMENPADEILEMLPAVIYFVNSNGLDTCFKNALHAVYGILGAIEPLIEVDLYELIDIRLDEITFESLFRYAIQIIAEETGYAFTEVDGNALLELTVGTLVSYTSANGKTAYTMVYQSETAKAEMVTVAMRLLITFLMTEDNREKAIGLLKDYLGMNEEAEKYVRAVLDLIATCTVETYLGMDKALATVYYIFYGTDIAAGETAGTVKDINAKWQEILAKLGKSDDPNEVSIGNFLAAILDGALEDIFTSEGLAPNGFIKLFRRLAEIIQKIIDFFKTLFA